MTTTTAEVTIVANTNPSLVMLVASAYRREGVMEIDSTIYPIVAWRIVRYLDEDGSSDLVAEPVRCAPGAVCLNASREAIMDLATGYLWSDWDEWPSRHDFDADVMSEAEQVFNEAARKPESATE